jgi:hypothetical protein
MKIKRRILFNRYFNIYNGGTSGGQLKVRDAFEHFMASDSFEPKVFFHKNTIWFDNPGNLWLPYLNSEYQVLDWEIKEGDVLFLAGKDWDRLAVKFCKSPTVPIVNIAHPRHTRKEDPRNGFLKYPAIRITKSSLSKKILEEYGVNGPIFCIPDAIDPSVLPSFNPKPDIDLLIVGLKNPLLSKKLYRFFKIKYGFKIHFKIVEQSYPKLPTRSDFLALLNRASTVVFLPLEEKYGAEGFYLPALEAMFLRKLVICPFAIGNVDFCLKDHTCLMPNYSFWDIVKSVGESLKMSQEKKSQMIENAYAIAQNHHIDKERQSYLSLLDNVDDLWGNADYFFKD